MQLSSWLDRFRRNIPHRRTAGTTRRSPAEALEQRELLTVTGVLIGTELSIYLDGNDTVAVRRGATGNIELLGNNVVVNSVPSIAATSISRLLIDGSDSDNTIDVSQLTTAQFPALIGITISGGNGTDRITGSNAFGESILGGDGNDIIVGNDGNNTINGGNGNDSITAGAGLDSLLGGDGKDTIRAGNGNDIINAGDGDDLVAAEDGNDRVDASHGADIIDGGNGNDDVIGGFGNDIVNGSAGDDTIRGGADKDTLTGGDGNDLMTGNAGNDVLQGEAGDDDLDGGEGNDSLDAGTGIDRANGAAGNDTALGGAGGDIVQGGAGNDSLDGNDGNDTITGNAGNDTITGGAGADSVRGGTGNDLIRGGGPSLSILDASIVEGNSGTTFLQFTVVLSQLSPTVVTADFATIDGSALVNLDYTVTATPVSFPPNTLTQTVRVPIVTDTVLETDENLYVTLTNAVGAELGDNVAEGIILNDDAAPIPVRTLYAADGTNNLLYRLDPLTGAATLIGSTGVPLFGLTSAPDGTVYGHTVNELYTVNTASGLATQVLNLGVNPIREGDIAYDPTTSGRIIGIDLVTNHLISIDLMAGSTTSLGTVTFGGVPVVGTRNWDGLAFRGNTLYGYLGVIQPGNAPLGLEGHLFTINTTTLAITDIGPLGIPEGGGGDIAYDPVRDIFYHRNNSDGNLFRIDPATGAATVIGDTTVRFTFGLEYAISGFITPQVVVVPPPVVPVAAVLGDFLFADDGDDTVNGSGGDDQIDGGIGNDLVDGDSGNDSVLGGTGNDIVRGGLGDDTVNGSAGNDTLDGGSANDTYEWDINSAGQKVLADAVGFQTLQVNGTAGTDVLAVSNASNRIKVTRGTASITANTTVSRVIINADAGADVITVQALNGVLPVVLQINGGAGNDVINANSVNLGNVLFQANGDADNDTLTGSASNDSLNGGTGIDSLIGNAGNDVISGGDDSDTIDGGTGNDLISGDAGDDSAIGGTGHDTINGGEGNDYGDGGDGNDSVIGGDGADTCTGSAGNDTCRGNNGDDALFGGTENDLLDGGVGNDRIRGHSGDDQIKGGDGNDTITGDAGIDTIDGGDGHDSIDGGFGIDSLPGGAGGILSGGDGNDTIIGGADDDTVVAGDGNDVVLTGGGQDVLHGGDGDDTLNGQGGTDQFNSGQGSNTIDAISQERDDQSLMISVTVLQALSVLNGL